MIPYRPEKIWVQTAARQDRLTSEILGRLPGLPVSTIEDPEAILPALFDTSDPHTSAKHALILTRFPGQFMKACPGSGAEICCNYFVLNYASNCHMECSYCVLQSYLNNPALMVFTNVDDMFAEIAGKLGGSPRGFFRIGTGEMADSLALDDLTGYSRLLVPFFARMPNAILELKTKSDRIANLKDLDHRNHTVVSWSLNSRPMCRREELKTAPFEARLNAARQCQQWGYRVGFHFDPLIWYDGWEGDYESAVKETFRAVDPGGIAWVSLGALRFTPQLREILQRRFPKSRIPYGEFVPGHHGKLRYFRPIRETMYRKMREWIQREAPGVFVYLCMESRLVWEGSLGHAPRDTADLSDTMDSLVRIDRC